MKRRFQGSLIVMVVLGLALLSPATTTWAKKAKKAPPKASSGREANMGQLDLSVHAMVAGINGERGNDDKVGITVLVKATSSSLTKICSGPFRVLVSKDVGGRWTHLASGVIHKMCVGGVRVGVIRGFRCIDYVPSDLGGAQKYRAEVDVPNRVDEMNETNNIGGTYYIPKPRKNSTRRLRTTPQ